MSNTLTHVYGASHPQTSQESTLDIGEVVMAKNCQPRWDF